MSIVELKPVTHSFKTDLHHFHDLGTRAKRVSLNSLRHYVILTYGHGFWADYRYAGSKSGALVIDPAGRPKQKYANIIEAIRSVWKDWLLENPHWDPEDPYYDYDWEQLYNGESRVTQNILQIFVDHHRPGKDIKVTCSNANAKPYLLMPNGDKAFSRCGRFTDLMKTLYEEWVLDPKEAPVQSLGLKAPKSKRDEIRKELRTLEGIVSDRLAAIRDKYPEAEIKPVVEKGRVKFTGLIITEI